MAFQKNKTSPARPFIIVIIVLLALVAVGIVGWNIFKYKFIKGKVKSTVYEKTNGLYTDPLRQNGFG